MAKRIFLYLLICLPFIACKTSDKKAQDTSTGIAYQPKFSDRFILENAGDEKRLLVYNPWQNSQDVELVYTLTNSESNEARTIKIPIERAVCLSSTYIAFIDCIDETDKIVGVSGAEYISNAQVQERIAKKEVLDVGFENYLSYETLAALKPDVVFAYGVEGELKNVETKLNELGTKIVYIGEYLEQSPLAKAEWVVAISAFFAKEDYAIAKFEEIEKEYNHSKSLVANSEHKPKVLLNAPFGDVWYVSATKSSMVNILKDAAGDYLFESDATSDTNPMSIEYVYTKALDADYWINLNAENSLAELKKLDSRFADIKALKNGNVFNNNKRQTKGGGNDFWESGVVNPHLILKDLIKILHPSVLPDHELYYYKQLQ